MKSASHLYLSILHNSKWNRKRIGYKDSHFSVDTSLMYIIPPWCVFGFPEWLWDSVDLLTWLGQNFKLLAQPFNCQSCFSLTNLVSAVIFLVIMHWAFQFLNVQICPFFFLTRIIQEKCTQLWYNFKKHSMNIRDFK